MMRSVLLKLSIGGILAAAPLFAFAAGTQTQSSALIQTACTTSASCPSGQTCTAGFCSYAAGSSLAACEASCLPRGGVCTVSEAGIATCSAGPAPASGLPAANTRTTYCVPGYMGKDCVTPPANYGSGGGINIGYLQQYSGSIIYVINVLLVPVLMAIAFIMFLWGVYKYLILGADNSEEREKGKSFVLWGVIGFVVIVSVWGLVAVVLSTFGLGVGGTAPAYPTL